MSERKGKTFPYPLSTVRTITVSFPYGHTDTC
uniref:Uncharacterized protein n=1 Tax=Anguilla anguilla TaxID=7936 RepID=A0A0E9U9R6_ANGAN